MKKSKLFQPAKSIAAALAVLAALLTQLTAPSVWAANSTWKGASNGNWNNSANWYSGIPGAADTATFDSTSANNASIYIGTTAGKSITNINFASGAPLTFNIKLAAGPNSGGAANLTLSSGGTITVADGKSHNIGTGSFGSGTVGTLVLGGNYNIATTSGNLTIDQPTSGSFTLTNKGSGTLTLSGTSDNSGLSVVANGGTLICGKTSSSTVHAFGNNSSIGSGGTIQLSGSGNYQLYNGCTLTVSSGGVFDLNGKSQDYTGGAANLNLNGTGSSSGGALLNSASATTSTLTFGTGGIVLQAASSIGGAGNITVAAGGVSGGFALTKVGAGTLTLSGAVSHSGGTTVSAGKLAVLSTATANGAVTNNATLAVTAVGASQWAPASLRLANPCTLEFNYIQNTGTTTAPLAPGAAIAAGSGVTININSFGTTPAVGNSYPLLGNAGTTNGYTLGAQPAGIAGHLGLGSDSSTLVYLVDAMPDVWAGMDSVNPAYWDIGVSTNWTGGAAFNTPANTYTNPNFVVFDDTALSTTVSIQAAVTPGGVTFNNSNQAYTVSASGANVIGGSGGLTLRGTNTVTLTGGAHSYTGPTAINAGTLQLGDGTSGNDATLAGTSGVTDNGALVFNRFGSTTASYAISGAGTVTKLGPGTQTLSGANTYTGTTFVSAGELDILTWGASTPGTVYVGTSLGSTGTLGIGGGTLNLGANGLFVGVGGSGIVNQTNGTVTSTSSLAVLIGNGSTGTYNLSGGTLTSFPASTRGVMIGVNNNGTGTFNLSGTGNLSMPGELAVGRDDVAGANNCIVTFNQTSGTAAVAYLSVGGQAGSLNTTAAFSLTGGSFVATNFQHLVAAASSSATLTLGGSAQVTLPAFPVPTGPATLTFDFTNGWLSPYAASAAYLNGLTAAYLTTNGANFNVAGGKDITVAQALQNASGQAGTLRKTGNGMLTLSGANTYSGATTISAGELRFSTAGSAATAITVVGAGATNGVLVASAGGQWVNTSDLTLSASGVLHLDYGSITPSLGTAPMQVNNLYPGAGLTCRIDGSQANFASGQSYPLITWTGSGPADATAVNTLILPNHVAGNLSVSGSTLYLNVTGNSSAVEPLSWNTGNGVWDTNTVNWVDAALTPQSYTDPVDAVVFDDASGATGSPTITLNSLLSPTSVTMKSTNHDYTISGSGTIAGTGALTLDAANTRTITLTTANTYTGNTAIDGGTLQLGNGVTQGSVAGNLIDNTALVVTNNADQTIANTLSGAGTLTKQGTGALTLSGANSSFTGTAAVNAGTLLLNSANALAGTTGITLAGGTTLTPNLSGITLSAPITNGTTGTTATITAPSAAGSGTTPVPFTLSGAISGAGNMVFNGVNVANAYSTINLNAAANYAGSTLITTVSGNAEIFVNLGVDNALPATTVLTLDGGNGAGSGRMCTLNLNGHSQTLAGLINVPGRTLRNQQVCNTSGTAATLTLSNSSACTFSGQLGYINYSALAANLGLTKSGTGVLTLSGNNIYANGTTIDGGTLLVNNTSGSGTGTGDVTVNSGGTLGGTGFISGLVTNNAGGTLAPGSSGIGALTLNGSVVLNSGSTNTFAVNGSTPSSTSVALGSAVTYGGVLNIVPSGTFTNGQTFTLFSGAGAASASNFDSITVSTGGSLSFAFTNGVLTVLSSGAPPQLAIAPVTVSGTNLVVSVPTTTGFNYVLQSATNLTPVISWLNESTNAGTGGHLILNVPIEPAKPQKFLRLRVY